MKTALILFAALAVAACATPAPIHDIRTQEVAVTHVERAVTEQQVRETVPPTPLGPRPSTLAAALDLVVAKLCEYVGYAGRADPLLQHAAGLAPVQRVVEPICQNHPDPH